MLRLHSVYRYQIIKLNKFDFSKSLICPIRGFSKQLILYANFHVFYYVAGADQQNQIEFIRKKLTKEEFEEFKNALPKEDYSKYFEPATAKDKNEANISNIK